jgi:hypothetical protein
VKIIPTKQVMSGSAEFTIQVERAAKVETGTLKPPAPTTRPLG